MKKTAIAFIVIGVAIFSWFGYKQWSGMQSVTKIDDDIIKDDNATGHSMPSPDKGEEMGDLTDDLEEITRANDYSDGDDVATLVMPSIDTSYDVFWGTTDDVLERGVGMFDSGVTTTPDQMGHTVLSGHRDSVFRPVESLEDGDAIYVRYQDTDYEYEIHKTWITDAADRSVIVDKDDPTLTLTTCYPFEYIGDAPDRYIVEAEYIKKGDLLDL